MNKKQSRLTWGGLLRILYRRAKSSFEHEHIRLIMPDGKKKYLNIKYDAQDHPYFIVVNDRGNYA